MRVMRPFDLPAAGITSNIGAEDPTPVWVANQAANSYALGALRHRVETRRVYERIKTEAGTGAEGTPPESDLLRWKDAGPTNRWAAFDPWRLSQKSTAPNLLHWVIRPGEFADGVWIGGISGATTYSVVARFEGVEYFRMEGSMEGAQRTDWYRYWTEPFLLATDLLAVLPELYPAPEIAIKLMGPADVSAGFVCVSKVAVLGFTRFGAKTGTIDYSTFKQAVDGTPDIRLRGSAKEMEASGRVDAVNARYVDAVLESVRSRPALFIASDLPIHEALRVFGVGSGTQSYDNPKFNTLNLKVKGL